MKEVKKIVKPLSEGRALLLEYFTEFPNEAKHEILDLREVDPSWTPVANLQELIDDIGYGALDVYKQIRIRTRMNMVSVKVLAESYPNAPCTLSLGDVSAINEAVGVAVFSSSYDLYQYHYESCGLHTP